VDEIVGQSPAAMATITATEAVLIEVATGRRCRNPLLGPLRGPLQR
jgi:hypothetical protein